MDEFDEEFEAGVEPEFPGGSRQQSIETGAILFLRRVRRGLLGWEDGGVFALFGYKTVKISPKKIPDNKWVEFRT